MSKKAVLLINLGTPNRCDAPSIYRYLTEFLNDPYVVDLPSYLRIPLVNLVIVPFRYKKTLAAYQAVWSELGSPLLIKSLQLKEALANALGADYHVELGMRYGKPSIQSALNKLGHAESLTVMPLFPQYAHAVTGSALATFFRSLSSQSNIKSLTIKRDFYHHPGFISAYADHIRDYIKDRHVDFILFSYHGLPERHIKTSSCQATCDRLHACPNVMVDDLHCYRAKCYATSELIAQALGLSLNQYRVSFQSRLGRAPWIKPYTDLLLSECIQQGIRHLAIVCPSFVTDCLETLEEVNIRTRAQWQKLGGRDFTFVPSLNTSREWVNALVDILCSKSA